MSRGAILYVITDLNVGGVPLHLRRLALAMRDRGFSPTVVSLAGEGLVGQRLVGDGITVKSCRGCCAFDLRVILRLAKILRREKPDIVHALLFHANLASRLAADWIGFPSQRVLCEIQTVEVERRWHLLADRWSHCGCRCVIGNSPSVIDHLATQARIPRHRLTLVRGGIDPAPFARAEPIDRAAHGLPPDARLILWIGRLDPVKGLHHLIGAFERGARDPRDHLVLLGDGALRDALTAQVNASSCSDRIHLPGSRDDVPRWLAAADVFVLPSRTEGLPNALLEAMAAGCPIVTTDVPGCRDLIEPDRTGLHVPFGDTHALASAIDRLLTDRDLAKRLGRAAAESVSREWHLADTMAAYEALYVEVLEGRPQT